MMKTPRLLLAWLFAVLLLTVGWAQGNLPYSMTAGQLDRGQNSWNGREAMGYTDRKFGGRAVRLYDSMPTVGQKILSVRIPTGKKATFYSESNYRGNKYTFTGTWSAASNDWWDGRIKSIRIESTGSSGGSGGGWGGGNENPWNGQATGYTERKFSGRSIRLSDNMSSVNGQILSIRLPAGKRITVYSETNYRGNTNTFTGTWSAATNDWWDGRIRSLRIETIGSGGGNGGGWTGNDPVGYTERGYRGSSIRLDRDLSSVNARILSIRVPRGQRVMLYSESNYRGNNHLITSDWSAANDDWWEGRIRSIRVNDVSVITPPNTRTATIYSGRNYTGTSANISNDWAGSNAWDGPTYIYSIRVPFGQRLILYSEPNFRGRTHEISGNWSAASGDFWERRIRSIRVYRDDIGNPGDGGDGGWTGGGNSDSGQLPTLYGEANYQGSGLPFNRDWSGFNLPNGPKSIRSISVPRGWRLVLYSQKNYQGQSLRVTGNFSPDRSSFWAENIRSIKVYGPGQ